MRALANFLTGLSLLFGLLSIICSLESQFTFACWAIIFSVVFDGLDGQVARMSAKPNEIGKELDSLVDVISFGVAPVILSYAFMGRKFNTLLILILFFYLLSSIVRLAKYNTIPKEKAKNCFYGLPTTAGGGLIASLILICRKFRVPAPDIFIYLVLFLSFMMIFPKIKYPNLNALKQFFGRKILWMVGVLAVILFVYFKLTTLFLPEIVIFMLFLLYLIFSPFVVKSLNIA